MRHLNRTLWLCAALVIDLANSPVATWAVSIDANLRSIGVNGPKQPLQATSASRSTPGGFSNSLLINDSNTTTSASQDSSLSQTATLVHITGNGSSSADRVSSTVSSIQQTADSLLDTNFTLLNNSPYVLSGRLTVDDSISLGGQGALDASFASIQLNIVNGATIFTRSSDGSFNTSGILEGGKTYHLRVESRVFVQTNQAFSKTNEWSLDLIASDVPEPTAGILPLMAAAIVGARVRRADGGGRTGL